ncbi:MAG: discoidin domain-containing protein [Opitutus sp.]
MQATTYYVDPAGRNSNNGTRESTAWQDFDKVNATVFKPGDKILLRRGGVWNQHFQLHGSGTADNFIEVAAYGTGSRPKIQRNSSVADRCFTTYNVSYVKISELEVCEAGAGIVIHYNKSYHHQSVYLDDIVAHGFRGIKTNQVPNPLVPDVYLHRGTNGWEGVTGAGHGPDPAHVSYWAPDDVAFSYGIGLTGAWDMANNSTTMLDDFRVTNCEVYNAGCGVALDWNNHTNRDGYFAGQVEGWRSPRNKVTNVFMDNLYIHDIDSPWVSLTGIFWTSVNKGVLQNSRVYKGAYFASGGTAQLHWYLSNDCLIDNIQVRTSVLPDPTTTDLSIADIGGCNGLEIRNSTFENIAGYGMGFLYDLAAAPDVSVHNLNIHHNTFLNIDWHWPNIMEVFHAVGSEDNHPTGTIHHNQWKGAPDVVLVGGKIRQGDPVDANWDFTTRFANDIIDSTSSGNDLAAGKSVTASSVLGTGYEASRLTDGDESTKWTSTRSGATQWIRIDLGAVMPINEVKIAWASPAYAVKYEVRVSQDGHTSETVHNRDLKYDLGTTRDIFTTRAARYVEIEMTAGNAAAANPPVYSIWTVQVFNDENLAQGRLAIASSTSASAYMDASKGNDGDDASRWTSAVRSGAATYTVDLGTSHMVNTVTIKWGSSGPKFYTIAVSPDNAAYDVVAEGQGIEGLTTTRSIFSRTAARYVKISMTHGVATEPVDYSIAEVRIFGARNHAQDANAFASSTTSIAGYDAQRAVDTNDNTSWVSAVERDACWFKVDLESAHSINEVITQWDLAYAKKYTVATSTDDLDYVTVATRSDLVSAGKTTDKFTSRIARFVKLTMTEGPIGGPANYSIKTLVVNNDLARGAACNASSSDTVDQPACAVDGKDTTIWSSLHREGTQWFHVDLGMTQIIDQVITEWGAAYAIDYTVETSTDDEHWHPFTKRLGVKSAITTDDKFDEPVSARFIRLQFSKGPINGMASYSIKSLSVYGPHP